MVFCNNGELGNKVQNTSSHNPYFNRWFSAINSIKAETEELANVTILILIDGFLQLILVMMILVLMVCHNPYFNRWFSAITFLSYQYLY